MNSVQFPWVSISVSNLCFGFCPLTPASGKHVLLLHRWSKSMLQSGFILLVHLQGTWSINMHTMKLSEWATQVLCLTHRTGCWMQPL